MKILVIYTGGTIGMINDKITDSLIPGDITGIKDFLKQKKLLQYCDLTTLSTLIDSSDFNKQYYSELSTIIKEEYYNYDSFLILMGTDTMAYVSSLLSFCISGLSKPIIFTGGQKTLYEAQSDSKKNLEECIIKIINHKFPNEVGIYFAENWHRSVCTTKQHSKDFNAYTEVIKTSYLPKKERFGIITKVSSNVISHNITPFNDENTLFSLLQNKNIDAIVLEIFGSGNMPNYSENLKTRFEQRIKLGLKVIIISQCRYGGLEIGRYKSSLNNSLLGFIKAKNMTRESMCSKLIFLLEKKLTSQEFEDYLNTSLRGELNS